MRGRAVAAYLFDLQEVGGSIPSPATKCLTKTKQQHENTFFNH